jgi:hypothetical protein
METRLSAGDRVTSCGLEALGVDPERPGLDLFDGGAALPGRPQRDSSGSHLSIAAKRPTVVRAAGGRITWSCALRRSRRDWGGTHLDAIVSR